MKGKPGALVWGSKVLNTKDGGSADFGRGAYTYIWH